MGVRVFGTCVRVHMCGGDIGEDEWECTTSFTAALLFSFFSSANLENLHDAGSILYFHTHEN